MSAPFLLLFVLVLINRRWFHLLWARQTAIKLKSADGRRYRAARITLIININIDAVTRLECVVRRVFSVSTNSRGTGLQSEVIVVHAHKVT